MNSNMITRREFGRLVSAGALCAATATGSAWARPVPAVALIGCGQRGRACLEAFAASEIAVVCDENYERAAGPATQTQADFTRDWRRCIAVPTITDVIVAVSDACTPEICRAALAENKRVFLECSDNSAITALMASLSAVPVDRERMSALFPHTPAATAIAHLIQSGSIGNVRFGHACTGNCNLRKGKTTVAEAHICQTLFMLTALNLGMPRHIATTGSGAREYADSLLSTLTFENNTQINISASAHAMVGEGVVIRGSDGHIALRNNRVSLYRDGAEEAVALPGMPDVRTATLRRWREHAETVDMACAVRTVNAVLDRV